MKLMNTLLIAGGGYFVLKYLGIDPLASIESLFSGSHILSSPVPEVPSTPQANGPITVDIKGMISNAMVADGLNPNNLFSVDVFNWYYHKLRGVTGPSPEELFANHDRNTNYTLDEYWGAMAGKGFSGLYSYHGMQGLGLIGRMNPWISHYTPGPGRTILPLGSETFIKGFGVN